MFNRASVRNLQGPVPVPDWQNKDNILKGRADEKNKQSDKKIERAPAR